MKLTQKIICLAIVILSPVLSSPAVAQNTKTKPKTQRSVSQSDLAQLQKRVVEVFKDKKKSTADRLKEISDLVRLEKIRLEKETRPVDLQAVGRILKQACFRCHKGEGSESGYAFNVLDVESMVDESMISEGDHESSEIWAAMASDRMPPRNQKQLPQPSYEDIQVIRNWIDQGAKSLPKPQPRPQISLKSVLKNLRADLLEQGKKGRFNVRYFSLTNLYNDPNVDLINMKMARLGLVKTLNSLSWEASLVKPRAIDEKETLYAVDITQLGWTRAHWKKLVDAYPYALSYGALDDVEIGKIDDDIADLRLGDRDPVVLRADWLISVATKPPLYYDLLFDLEIPALIDRPADPENKSNPKQMTDRDLEKFLGIDATRNILEGKVWRAAFTQSGISDQNRMIERHQTKSSGFYWKSYDFLSSNRKGILSEFPIGPKLEGSPFNQSVFEHDGGEIIFSLPNGLQGYLLVDAAGNRIDAGPIEVVADSLKTSGNEQIFSGISCIACHRNGMIEAPDDEVRKFSGVVGPARKYVRQIYPENEVFKNLIAKDTELFMRALRDTVKPYVGNEDIAKLPEPVGEVARLYHLEPMKIGTVAAELNISLDRLRSAIQTDPRLRELGLRVLLREGGTIKRAAWESSALMKLVARQFGYDNR